ncbi:MAG: Tol biopolymer transport system component [Candidatus Krumholzibacteriia bacterium]
MLMVNHGDLVAQPFDPDTGQLSGSPFPLVEDVMTIPGASKCVFSASENGELAYLKGETAGDSYLTWRDRNGSGLEEVGDMASYDLVALSPDGRSAAVSITSETSGTWDIWVVDLERNFRTRFTVDAGDDGDMVWGHDSQGIYFVSDREGDQAVYYKGIGSPEAPHKVFSNGENLRLWDVSDDGNTIFYARAPGGSAYDLWSTELSGEAEPRMLRKTAEQDAICQLSPDEKWLSFGSEESGRWQVYVAPWPEMAPITQVSTTSGTWHKWTKDGSELIFHEESGSLTAVSMTPNGNRMSVGQPEQLFDVGSPVLENIFWSVAADGERFFLINSQSVSAPKFCNLVLDWPRILEKNNY